ncbi:LysR family transcriptional regulator [Hydrogenophaga flava]|uniref:LysR family transcriptional regulator n=1 Tax=Hydrogenophaga flava TaxID=65657 RepID=UPI0008247988|nr:LysR family transcriptional regulator [Hydrogenophaga flava]
MQFLPTTTALRCLDASARSGSFTRAAKELNLTQSAVSNQILNLERQLGVTLFDREHGRLELTPVGRLYWEETLAALQQLHRATRRITDKSDKHSTLTVSAPSSFANLWLMPRIGEFVRQNPEVRLNLIDRSDAQGAQSAQSDAAIELCETHPTGMSSVCLLSLVYRPYASPALLCRPDLAKYLVEGTTFSPQGLPDLLKSVPLIRTSMANAWEAWLRLANLDREVEPGLLAEGPAYAQASLALTAVISGIGVALLPGYVADGYRKQGAITQLSSIGWPANRAYRLQWNSDATPRAGLRRLIEWAETIATSELDVLAGI